MTRRLGVALLVLCGSLGCGYVGSIHPIYLDSDLNRPILDSRIEGQWISPDLDNAGIDQIAPMRWKISRSPQVDTYAVELRGGDSADDFTLFDVRLTDIDAVLFFDAEFIRNETATPSAPFLVPGHMIGRIWLQQDLVRFAVLDPGWVEKHTSRSFRIVYPGGRSEDSVALTGSTEEVRKFLAQYADDAEAFARFMYLCRPGVDCKLMAVEDLLEWCRPEDDVLDYAAEVFSVRGMHARAVSLRRQRVESDPRDVDRWFELGDAHLLNRDFASARDAFAAAKRLDAAGAADRATIGTAWSYFLEGSYASVLLTLNAYAPPRDNPYADAILLAYFSRARLGSRARAESGLRASAGAFVGGTTEHLLLLRAQQRLTDRATEGRAAFFEGLAELVAGRPERARQLPQIAASTKDDSTIALAARIELERLASR